MQFPKLYPQIRPYWRAKIQLGLSLIILLLIGSTARAQVDCPTGFLPGPVLSEVTVNGEIEIYNGGGSTVNLTTYWLCNFPSYQMLGDLTLECGSLMLAPNETVVVSGFNALNVTDGELGLYRTGSFGSSDAIVSYLEWGSSAHRRSSVAVGAGIWTDGFRVDAPLAGASVQTIYANNAIDWTTGTENTCAADASLLTAFAEASQSADAGAIALASGSVDTTICVDGVADPLEVVRDGDTSGEQFTFLITDAATNEILAIPGKNGPFDLDGAGPGICQIWYLAYFDGLNGLAVGNLLSDLNGCFDISNPIDVDRQENNGGGITLEDGSTAATICVDGVADPLTVIRDGSATGANRTFLITDAATNEILAIPGNDGPFDLDGAGGGVCDIWYLAYSDGLEGLMVGNNVSDLSGCFDLSNPIAVTREANDGGGITLEDGSTAATICVDGVADPLTVIRDGSATGANRTFLITDAATNEILAIPGNDGPFDLDGAGGGVCDIWYLAYSDDLEGLMVGNNVSDLSGCFDLSNPIAVTREENNGGGITLEDGSTAATICVDGVADPLTVIRDGSATGANRTFLITDAATNEILAIPGNDGPFDLDGAGGGVCDIWYLAYSDGLEGLMVGNNVSDLSGCFDLSNPIAVTREENNGGGITLADGSTSTSICVDGVADPLEVIRDGSAMGANRTFLITDAATNEILAIPDNNGPFDLDGAGDGICDIWYLAYSDGLEGLMVGNNVSDLSGCFDLSNPISVNRQSPDGGMVMTTEGATILTATAGDVVVEVSHTTTADALSYWYIITDDNNGILAFANSAQTSVLDLSGAPAGTCRIWGWSYRGEGDPVLGEDISTLADGDCEAISSNFITVVRQATDCMASGGGIMLEDGSTAATICVDGVADPLTVIRDGNGMGANRTFVITDAATNEILAIPGDNGPFDLDGAGGGVCDIWYLGYEDGLTGLAVGNSLTDLEGCFGLSNPIAVTREENNGGGITLADGSTATSICVDGVADPLEVIRDGNAMGANRTFLITDAATNEILAIPGSNGPFDLDGAGDGICDIWYLAYSDGLEGLMVGNNVSDLMGCFDLSNPISVDRQSPDGGMVMTVGGETTVTATAGDVIVEVSHTTTADALSYWYIITDDNDAILAFANSAETNTLDLSGAPAGTCRIWGWSYRGEGDPVVGEDISTLADGDCEAISSNFITVIREAAGFDFTDVIINEVTATGQVELFNGTDAAIDVSDYWLCNRPTYQQLSQMTVECGSLMIQPGEYLVVSGFTGFNAVDAELGLYTTNEFSNSDAIVSYLEWGSAGHGRSATAIAAGIWMADFFVTAPTETQSIQTFVSDDNELTWSLADETVCAPNDNSTSTNDLDLTADIRLFPNPTSGAVTLNISGLPRDRADFQLFDQTGRMLLEQRVDFGNGRHQISLDQFPAGTYFLRILNGPSAAIRRVTKF
ncbi:T9SS type A sorting domain-containing protein [Lewinella sp. W8]|uniref:T9SS type A sorting domain-containing protein n=1 Tax=Lewinella sp. W8 TaxID=2528208 RepID=UPI00106869D4|nr:T9SS type A sorting domain-containing protein [Lewinella sp. W8]MTB52537.1 T9SS type A sorting domain-containing protein [Lewinella sp. W8]